MESHSRLVSDDLTSERMETTAETSALSVHRHRESCRAFKPACPITCTHREVSQPGVRGPLVVHDGFAEFSEGFFSGQRQTD